MTLSARVVNRVVIPKVLEIFPWLQSLPEEEQAEFWNELWTAFRKAAQNGDWAAVKQAMDDWKATAEVKGTPQLQSALTQNIQHGEWVNWHDARASLQNRTRKKIRQRA